MLDVLAINRLKEQLARHPLYRQIKTVEDLRHFMQGHVYCTWDFMSLLKSLQLLLTSMSLPWVPPKHMALARLINEIVMDEETDIIDDQAISHFELYRKAMEEAGCSMASLEAFTEDIRHRVPVKEALTRNNLPLPVQAFVKTTFEMIQKPVEVQAAVFFHGREDIIPGMFIEIVSHLEKQGLHCPSLMVYLERHIEVDGDKHGPLAEKLLAQLLADRPEILPQVQDAIEKSLQARLQLWDYLASPALVTC